MVRAFLFIQMIGEMTNECGNKRSVRLRREMNVLSAGRSGTSTVSTGNWPELLGSMSHHSSPQGQRAGTLILFWSFCHPPLHYLLVNEQHVTLIHAQPPPSQPPTHTQTHTTTTTTMTLHDLKCLDVNHIEVWNTLLFTSPKVWLCDVARWMLRLY